MKTLLVPIDFSRVSRYVLAEAAKLARLTRSRIALLHVVQPPTVISDYGPVFESVVQFTAQAEKASARRLASLKAKLKAGGIQTVTVLKTGSPVFNILEQAKKLAAAYIVVGTHGHTAFYDLLVGSTTSGVLKRTTCPVLVVPTPSKEKTLAKKK